MLFASMNHALFMGIPYQWLTLLVEVGFVAAFILIFGDIIPKVYANRNAESFALLMALPLFIIDRYLLFFLAVPLSKFTYFFQKRLQKRTSDFSVDQLSKALEMTEDSATSNEEQKLLEGIVNFGNALSKIRGFTAIDDCGLKSPSISFSEAVAAIESQINKNCVSSY